MNSLDALFSDIDDFCQNFEPRWHSDLIAGGQKNRRRAKSLYLSEIITILVTFHQHHDRNFKHYYLDHVSVYRFDAFPGLPSYGRFVEWIPQTLLTLCVYLKQCFGACTGISFISPGQVVKALILNGLGFLSAPLDLFEKFFVGKATEVGCVSGALFSRRTNNLTLTHLDRYFLSI